MKVTFISGEAMQTTYDPLRSTLHEHWGRLTAASVLLTASAALELLPHLVVYAAAICVFDPVPQPDALTRWVGWAFVGITLRFVLLGVGYILSHSVAFSMMGEVRLRLTEKLARVPGQFFRDHPSGDLKKVVIDDVASLEGLFAHNIPEFISGLLVPVLGAGILFWSDWRMGALSLVLMPVAIGIQAVTMRGYADSWAQWHQAEAKANEGVLEFIRGVAVLKAFERDASSLARVREGVYGIRDLAVTMTRRSMVGYSLFFSLLSGNLLVVLPAGLGLYLSGEIVREQLVLFVAIGTGLLVPLMRLLFLFGGLQHVTQALARVRKVAMAEELSEPTTAQTKPSSPEVCFESVSFTYPGRQAPALREISLVFEPSTTTAIVGSSGAGKTTLLKLLVRAYDPEGGSITIGGTDLRTLTSTQRTHWISHVSQGTTLFDASVEENLRLARPDASAEEIRDVARAAHAHDFIEALPEGYATALGDRGAHLSGGERQRLAIARALLAAAPIIVLDEVTANVDSHSERGIQEGIARLAKGRVVVVVAHRLRTVVNVERIVVMDAGQVVDEGRHTELLERCPAYRSLWTAQEQAEGWSLGGGVAC
ncbi:MAG: ABC transporter ATP-binding protein/permease [Nannocystaceae bacterium]|nr:ABC transporter ATP-binding protein/permease [Nannocystaceae bacterium]